jgi:hypothetical protein
MTKVVYEVVEHEGGWAYRVGDVYSENISFPSSGQRSGRASGSRARASRRNHGHFLRRPRRPLAHRKNCKLISHQNNTPTVLSETPSRQWSRWKNNCSVVTRKSLTPTLRTTWIVLHTAIHLMKGNRRVQIAFVSI